jgi:Ca2+-binding RTX toxin-like protein
MQCGLDVLESIIFDISGYDTVEFADRISTSDVWLVKDGNNLQLRFSDSDPMDRLTISNWFGGFQIEEFIFADGTVWSSSDLMLLGITVFGTSGSDSLGGSNFNDTIYGYDGNDIIYGGNGDDVLYGGDGDDKLYGEAGNDTLDGGFGNDYLCGGIGNDTYIFNVGYGQDVIYDYDITVGNTDIVLFGFDSIDIIFTRASNDLVITFYDSTDKLTIQYWYLGGAYQVEVFTASDGRTLLNSQVNQLVQAMSTFCSDNGLYNWDQAISQRPQDVAVLLAPYWAA